MKLYCSSCGKQLSHSRSALKGKGVILDLVDPHDCEGFAVGSNEDGSPTVKDLIESLPNIGCLGSNDSTPNQNNESGSKLLDMRGDKDKKSTAPKSLLNTINRGDL